MQNTGQLIESIRYLAPTDGLSIPLYGITRSLLAIPAVQSAIRDYEQGLCVQQVCANCGQAQCTGCRPRASYRNRLHECPGCGERTLFTGESYCADCRYDP